MLGLSPWNGRWLMSIWILIKSQLKNRKATYISIVVLAIIISMVLAVSISTEINANQRASKASVEGNYSEVVAMVDVDLLDHFETTLGELDEVAEIADYTSIVPFTSNSIYIDGERYSSDSDQMLQVYDHENLPIRLMNEQQTDYLPQTEVVEPASGEVWLPISAMERMGAELGDSYEIRVDDTRHEFTVAGFVEDIMNSNAITTGFEPAYINENDWLELEEFAIDNPQAFRFMSKLYVYQDTDVSDLSDLEFLNLLDDESNLIGISHMVMTRDDLIVYNSTLTRIFLGIILLFVVLIFIAAVLIISFSISSSIESEYTNIGALKAIGRKNSQINLAYMATYLLSLLLGFSIGCLLAIPLTGWISTVMLPATSMLIGNSIAWVETIAILFALLVIILLIIYFNLRKVNKIKPREALNEGRQSVHFSQGLNLQLKKPYLFTRLSMKQFSANFSQYIVSILIVAILFAFTLIITSLNNVLTPDRMLSEFYGMDYDLMVYYDIGFMDEDRPLAEAVIEDKTDIVSSYEFEYGNVQHEHDLLQVFVMDDTELITSLLEGRYPRHDNEVLITEFYADRMGLDIGEKINLSYIREDGDDAIREFIITGLFQTVNLNGLTVSMSSDAYETFDPVNYSRMVCYMIADKELQDEIVTDINGLEYVSASSKNDVVGNLASTVNTGISALTILIIIIAIIFILVSAYILAEKIFRKETSDYGIMKAIGIKNSRLKNLFSNRFIVLAIFALGLGYILYLLTGDFFLGQMGAFIGLSRIETQVPLALTLALGVVFILVLYLMARLVSRKINRLQVRNLLTAV